MGIALKLYRLIKLGRGHPPEAERELEGDNKDEQVLGDGEIRREVEATKAKLADLERVSLLSDTAFGIKAVGRRKSDR